MLASWYASDSCSTTGSTRGSPTARQGCCRRRISGGGSPPNFATIACRRSPCHVADRFHSHDARRGRRPHISETEAQATQSEIVNGFLLDTNVVSELREGANTPALSNGMVDARLRSSLPIK